MKRDRMLQLADHIEDLGHDRHGYNYAHGSNMFDMSKFEYKDGYPACIAGHAVHLFGDPNTRARYTSKRGYVQWSRYANELLGLHSVMTISLYAPGAIAVIKPHHAAKHLRDMAEMSEKELEDRGIQLFKQDLKYMVKFMACRILEFVLGRQIWEEKVHRVGDRWSHGVRGIRLDRMSKVSSEASEVRTGPESWVQTETA